MLHLLSLPFHLLGGILSAILWVLLLPLHLALWLLGLVFGIVSFGLQLGLWIGCIALSVLIGRSRGLNPLLCLVLGALGPLGLLLVIGLAMMRPARAF